MSTKLAKERILRNVIALRLVELEDGNEAIGDVREDLERLVGPTVSRALAARVRKKFGLGAVGALGGLARLLHFPK